MADLKTIEQNITQNTNLEQSAVALVNGLADALDDLTQDPVAIKQLAGQLRSSASTLGRAVIANTQATAPQGSRPTPPPPHVPAPSTTPPAPGTTAHTTTTHAPRPAPGTPPPSTPHTPPPAAPPKP